MSNNITAYFKGRMGVTEALYQNDYGIIMNFDGISLPAHFDCYFSIDGEDEAVPAVGSDDMVQIPNACLAHAGKIELHIPLHSGENDSEVEYVVYTKVIGRARPVDDGTPVQMTAIEQALALLQNPIGNIEQIVNEALSFTGETFAEMQEQLDADQAAFQSDMGDRADAFEAQIQSDISDVESDFDNLNAQYQTAVAAHTVDSEVQNVRVGADNVTYASAGEAVRTQFTNLKNEIDELDADINGLTTKNYLVGKKLVRQDGSIVDDTDKCVSEKIPYTWSGYARYYYAAEGIASLGSDYFVCFYDSNDNLLGAFKNPSSDNATFRAINADTQVTGAVSYVRFTFKKGYNGKITESASTPIVNYWVATDTTVESGLVQKVGNLDDLSTEEKSNLVGAINELSASITAKHGSLSIESASLASGATLSLDDAPRFIKKNVGITAHMNFASFSSVTIGKGYNLYRGRWVTIDSTNITPYFHNGSSVVADTPIPHGLTIGDYIQCSMYMAADGKCRVSINALSGTFSTTIDFAYEWNYAPFVFGAQAMTDVNLCYSCADLLSDLWMFGDSYMGIAVNRIAGQLKNLGFFNYCINAIAGGRAVHEGTPNKSASEDLGKMLALATPKYIIWTLGMNGGDADNIAYLPTLISLCESKEIELILYMPPSIPSIDHTALNNYIASTGLRYIDGNDAVGATSSGVWYAGYLSNDEIHPSSLGAMALAMRFLADAPELMQYGFSTGTVDGEIDGDEH